MRYSQSACWHGYPKIQGGSGGQENLAAGAADEFQAKLDCVSVKLKNVQCEPASIVKNQIDDHLDNLTIFHVVSPR